MLTVTTNAGECLAEMVRLQGGPDDSAVRIWIENDELALRLDCQRSGDASFMHDDRPVLLLDLETATYLVDDTLDCEDGALTLFHAPD